MPELPEPRNNCPDNRCAAPLGAPHRPDCEVAVCVATGEQRLLHRIQAPAPAGTSPFRTLTTHSCGFDTWRGQTPGVVECYQLGWFVRRATPDDTPLEAVWIPCPPGPGAVPDLTRLATHATWSPATMRWHPREEVPGRG